MNVIQSFIEENRLFQILIDRVHNSDWYDRTIEEQLFNYLESYLNYIGESTDFLTTSYSKYIKAYNKDIKKFLQHGKYPLELEGSSFIPNRKEYNSILLFSIVMSPHRMRIMRLIKENRGLANPGSSLFIGCGPGFEIELVRSIDEEIVAYDLEVDSFTKEKLKGVDFRSEYFDGSNSESFSSIYLIELLEHLEDPYNLLKNCNKVLESQGLIYLTTATNMPQFDHVYNFEVSHQQFEEKMQKYGLEIILKEPIIQKYMTSEIESRNTFYILKKP